jgi:hypothetical protein
MLLAPLCQKHHRKMHELLLRAETSPRYQRDRVKRVAMALRSAAVYDRARADAMDRWAQVLELVAEKKQGRRTSRVKPDQRSGK